MKRITIEMSEGYQFNHIKDVLTEYKDLCDCNFDLKIENVECVNEPFKFSINNVKQYIPECYAIESLRYNRVIIYLHYNDKILNPEDRLILNMNTPKEEIIKQLKDFSISRPKEA